MENEEKNPDYGNREVIDRDNRLERVFWAQKLGVSEKQLSEAMEQCSECRVQEIMSYLRSHKYMT